MPPLLQLCADTKLIEDVAIPTLWGQDKALYPLVLIVKPTHLALRKTRVTSLKSNQNLHVLNLLGFIGVWKAVSCLKLTGEKAGIGLRQENFGFPESKKLKPDFFGL